MKDPLDKDISFVISSLVMKQIVAVLPILLIVIGIFLCLLAIDKRLSSIECQRCAVWDWEVCEQLDCQE